MSDVNVQNLPTSKELFSDRKSCKFLTPFVVTIARPLYGDYLSYEARLQGLAYVQAVLQSRFKYR